MYLLIQANDVSITISVMKGTMGDYTSQVSESPIMDVFPYFSGEEGNWNS
jgi:hypothetical protein